MNHKKNKKSARFVTFEIKKKFSNGKKYDIEIPKDLIPNGYLATYCLAATQSFHDVSAYIWKPGQLKVQFSGVMRAKNLRIWIWIEPEKE